MLIMDSNEARNQPKIAAQLSKVVDSVSIEHLVSGDFASVDSPITLGIERKSYGDLLGSLASGKLDEQLSRLVNTYDICMLLIEGLPSPDKAYKLSTHPNKKAKKIDYRWVMGELVGWYARGVCPLMLNSINETPIVVATWYKFVCKKEHRVLYKPVKVLPNLHAMNLRERVLIQFEGIGEQLASDLAHAGKLYELADMELEEWQRLLGPVRGKRMYEAWLT